MDKQTITGDGTTGPYTLDHAVGSEQEIEVFVNNVRQEPSVAYTVVGTALTMTGNVASTDDFYVVFQGKAQQSVTHPSNSALQATTGTFSSNVDVGGSLLVDTIKEGTGTNTALSIGSNGLIQPKQVAFQVEALDTDQAVSASGSTILQFPTTSFDTGGYWDSTNHRYTPQVAGWYYFGGMARMLISGINQVLGFKLRKNGGTATGDYISTQIQLSSDLITNGSYPFPTGMFQLNGSTDYVEITANGEEAMTFSDANNERSVFYGFLVHAT
jgi:hypothetical protein